MCHYSVSIVLENIFRIFFPLFFRWGSTIFLQNQRMSANVIWVSEWNYLEVLFSINVSFKTDLALALQINQILSVEGNRSFLQRLKNYNFNLSCLDNCFQSKREFQALQWWSRFELSVLIWIEGKHLFLSFFLSDRLPIHRKPSKYRWWQFKIKINVESGATWPSEIRI